MVVLLLAVSAHAATLSVGPNGAYPEPCAAIAAASPGDVVEIDAAGDYAGTSCSWSTDGLTVRGVGGRPVLDVTGVTLANQKGIFVIAADHATIESVEFAGASVPDANGAGIRHQGLDLTVRDCVFHDNEDGILGSPRTDGQGTVVIEHSIFHDNGAGDGYSHNVYLNHYAKVTFEANDSTASHVGHLFKSRALETHVLYNRLADEPGGTGSYELDLPNAGRSYVIGNVIEQSAESQNHAILAYGEETSGMNPDTHLFVVNNTFVNHANAGMFVAIGSAITEPAVLMNDVFTGPGTVCAQADAQITSCHDDGMGDPGLVDPANLDVHLTAGSACVDAGADPGAELSPSAEYASEADETPRSVVAAAIDLGAFEFGNPTTDTGAPDSDTEGDSDTDTSPASGCGCAGSPLPSGWIALGIAALALRRRSLARSARS